MATLKRSAEMFERAKRSLAGGVSSNVRTAGTALFFDHGNGSRLYDVDGNEYVDYVLGQGPAILGHCAPAVVGAVQEALERGQLYAGQHALEIELSEKLSELIPCAELVRYSNSGSEAVHAALRVARAYTGCDKTIRFEGHYHGWFDDVLISVHPPADVAGAREHPRSIPGSMGQPKTALERSIVLPWNDLGLLDRALERHRGDVAAVIMEPIMCNTGCILPYEGYLEGVRALCDEHGVVLIFDEIITGFRVGLGGAQGYFGVVPDLATFGKAMANGFPISCLAGKRELMELIADGRVNHSGTYNSNVVVMAAAIATVTELEKGNGATYDQLTNLGLSLMKGLEERFEGAGRNILIQGLGPMFHLAFTSRDSIVDYRSFLDSDVEAYGRFVELLLEEGIRVIPRGIWYLSAFHTEKDIKLTLEAVERAIDRT